MGGSTSAPPPPDTSRFSNQASNDANMQRDWAQSMWDSGQQEWGNIQQWAQSTMGMALPAMEDAFDWAREQRDNFNTYVMPQMESLFSEAETYASQAEQDRQRGAAIQDVGTAMEAQREASQRKLSSYGADPTVVAAQAMDRKAGVQQAAVQALAANQAGERTKQIGRQMRGEAIGLGTQFLQDANQSAQVGSQIGNQALSTASNANLAGSQMAQGAIPYMQGAAASNAQGAGIVDTSYGREIDYAQDQRAAESADAAGWQGLVSGGMQMAGNYMTGGAYGALTGTGLPKAAEGGEVQAPGGPTSDSGAIAISDGEYVVPADVVRKLGTNHFDKMIEKETGRPPPVTKQALPIAGGFK